MGVTSWSSKGLSVNMKPFRLLGICMKSGGSIMVNTMNNMSNYESIAVNIIRYFSLEKCKICLLVDEAFVEIGQSIKDHNKLNELIHLHSCTPQNLTTLFSNSFSEMVLLLAEPKSYGKYRLFQYLDFSKGEPQIANTASKVLIFPKESICRMFSGKIEKIRSEKEKIISNMKANQRYRITSAEGTDLVFEARTWIPLDFEICTAPKENSINGIIVVDGSLFFKRIDEKISFVIKDGKIHDIMARSSKGEEIVTEYRNMTDREMKDIRNRQLAEIGIGVCSEAIISDCFMESEAALDTCHFCFGNNTCYGGENESEFHGASILIKNPVFTCVE